MLRDTCSFSQLRKGSQEERRGDYPPLPLDDWLRRLTYTYQMKYASLCKIWKKISTKLFLTNADEQLF